MTTILNRDYGQIKQLKNVEYLNYLGTMMINDAICIHEIKS
jgi:hypothetical protein